MGAPTESGRNLIQFDMKASEGLAAICAQIGKDYQIDMDKHGLLLVVNTGTDFSIQLQKSTEFSKNPWRR